MTDRELLEIIAAKVSSMDTKLTELDSRFDGYKQHTEQLDRIEKAVIEHDELLFNK